MRCSPPSCSIALAAASAGGGAIGCGTSSNRPAVRGSSSTGNCEAAPADSSSSMPSAGVEAGSTSALTLATTWLLSPGSVLVTALASSVDSTTSTTVSVTISGSTDSGVGTTTGSTTSSRTTTAGCPPAGTSPVPPV